MNTRQPTLARDAAGFFLGGILGALAAGLVFVAFFQLPKEQTPQSHVQEVFAMTVLVMFFCGGFIGRRGFSAETWTDLVPSVLGTYTTVILFSLIAGLDFAELLPLIGFASVGVMASTAGSLLLVRSLPVKEQPPELD